MSNEKRYVLYEHVFPNGKVYIGITRQDPEIRWQYGNGYVRNPVMHRAIKKYGWDNILHIILFNDLTEEEAASREIELIKQLRATDKRYGYNIEGGGTCPTLAEETKEKIRAAHLGKKANETTRKTMCAARQKFLKENPDYYKEHPEYLQKAIDKAAELKRKAVLQLDLEGNVLNRWESTRAAERALGIYHSHIGKCCNKKPLYNTAGGYRWEYAPE